MQSLECGLFKVLSVECGVYIRVHLAVSSLWGDVDMAVTVLPMALASLNTGLEHLVDINEWSGLDKGPVLSSFMRQGMIIEAT